MAEFISSRRPSTPGANQQVLFNANGLEGASPNLTFNVASNTLTVPAIQVTNATISNLTATSFVGPNATTSQRGVTELIDSVASADTGNAATANAVRTAMTQANTLTGNANLYFQNSATMNILASVNVAGVSSNITFQANQAALLLGVIPTNPSNIAMTYYSNGNVGIDTIGGGGSGTPGGSNTQIQFNQSGNFGGDLNLTYNVAGSVIGNTSLSAPLFVVNANVIISGNVTETTLPDRGLARLTIQKYDATQGPNPGLSSAQTAIYLGIGGDEVPAGGQLGWVYVGKLTVTGNGNIPATVTAFPAGIQNGDLIVIGIRDYNISTTVTAPTTNVGTYSTLTQPVIYQAVFAKYYSAGEALPALENTVYNSAVGGVWRWVGGTAPAIGSILNANTSDLSTSTGNIEYTSLTTTNTNCLCIFFGATSNQCTTISDDVVHYINPVDKYNGSTGTKGITIIMDYFTQATAATIGSGHAVATGMTDVATNGLTVALNPGTITSSTNTNFRLIGFGYCDNTSNNYPAYIGYSEDISSTYTCGHLVFGTRTSISDIVPTTRLTIANTGALQAPTSPLTNTTTQIATGMSVVMTSSGTTRSNSSLTTEANLAITINEAGVYELEGMLFFYELTSGAGGFLFDLDGGTANVTWISWGTEGYVGGPVANAAGLGLTSSFGYTSISTSATSPSWVKISGTLNSANSGTFIPRWGQSVTNANVTNLLQGSRIKLMKIG